MTPNPEPDKESQAISVMSFKGPRMISAALSVKTVTEKSMRDRDGQVTEGRFEPQQFNEEC